MNVRCFLLVPTDQYVVSLRRYASIPKGSAYCPGMPGEHSYHNASVNIDVVTWDGKSGLGDRPSKVEVAWGWGGDPVKWEGPYPGVTSYQDHRWPKKCDRCGYVFADQDEWQLNLSVLFDRSDGGPRTPLCDAPCGAMWFGDWTPEQWRGPDRKTLFVRLPGGHDWMVDGQASNCTRPDDEAHRCWVRHGTAPLITVDKDGNTCQAGAGSIVIPGWHGFLRNGELVEC